MANNAKFALKYSQDVPEESSSLSSGTVKSAKLASLEAFSVLGNQNGVKNGVSFKNYRSLCMAARKQKLFKDPKIVRCKNGDWYVGYYFRDPANPSKWYKDEFKERCGINYIKDQEEKEREFEILRLDVLNWLLAGNSPFDKEKAMENKIIAKEQEIAKIISKSSSWSIGKAIEEYDKYTDANGHSPTTVRTYKKYTRAFYNWLLANELLDHKASNFTEMDVQGYLDEMLESQNWSNRTFNNYLEFMITFFVRCRKLEKKKTGNRQVKYDFDPEDLEPKITKPQRNKAFTPLIEEALKKELIPDYPNLSDYLEWIKLSLMRPDEIRHLKIKDIDHVNRQIRIMGKTGDRIVPISDQLMALIDRRNLLNSNLNNFIFGYMGNVDSRRMSVAYFLSQFAAIRKKLALDPNYGPYSMKPTGVIRMIKAGFKDREIMELTGHKTESAFNAYKRDLIIENSHVMKGSTIDF